MASLDLDVLLDGRHAELVKQGAEARVYRAPLFVAPPTAGDPDLPATLAPPPPQILLKHRFPKRYRHPTLDAQLTRSRITHEARSLIRAARAGVNVPGVRAADADAGILGLEWVEGWTVREVLGGGSDEGDQPAEGFDGEEESEEDAESRLEKLGLTRDRLLTLIGEQLALLHLSDIIHGDLTTSNLMLRPSTPSAAEVVVIDFGLSFVSTLSEDKAVDLYVLERAIEATHPEEREVIRKGKGLYKGIERAYAERLGVREWEKVERKLREVRLRGRKMSMVG